MLPNGAGILGGQGGARDGEGEDQSNEKGDRNAREGRPDHTWMY